MPKISSYPKPLFILAFDQRASLAKDLLKTEKINQPEIATKLTEFKTIVYQGFKLAVNSKAMPAKNAAILIDEQFGKNIITDAKKNNYTVCLTTEKSGTSEFTFNYGKNFASHINKYHPQIVKALVRYNPAGDKKINIRQQHKLKLLSDFCWHQSYPLMLEVLVPATADQLASCKNQLKTYEQRLRPQLMLEMISELQTAGIKPAIWKIEGLDKTANYQKIIKQIKSADNSNSSMIILGRGADKKVVDQWLKAGRLVVGVIGFAIGRTIFKTPLQEFVNKKITASQAAKKICNNYLHFYKTFTN